jgi:nitrogen fixation protein FixH
MKGNTMKIAKIVSNMLCVAVLSIGAITTVNAHDNAYFDSNKSANGGQTRMAGVYHFELVLAKDSKEAKENSITVYVTDHASKALATTGGTASLTIVQGKNKSTVTLQPSGTNQFIGKAVYASNANFKGALTVTMAGKPAEQARFTPFAPVKKAAEKKEAEHEHHH